MQVLADAIARAGRAGRVLVGPARQSLVDHGAAGAADVGHPQHVAPERIGAALLVDDVEVHDTVRHPVVGQLGPHPPLGDRDRPAAVPDPAPVQVARLGAEPDAAEVHAVIAEHVPN